MKTVFSYILQTNNFLNIYKIEEGFPEDVERSVIEKVMKNHTKDACYFLHPNLYFGDFDERAAADLSNVQLFLKQFKGKKGYQHLTGAYNYEAIVIDITCSDTEIIEFLKNIIKK